MTSTRPYLIRAIYEWIVDNGHTPHLLVEVVDEGVRVPEQFVENGVIVLNVAPGAVRDLALGNDAIEFDARFAGQPRHVHVPVSAVQAIYARENGQGIMLGEAEPATEDGAEQRGDRDSDGGSRRRGPPHLTIVE